MPWVSVDKIPVSISSEDFWRGVAVWNKVPHVVNRRLACSEALFNEQMQNDIYGSNLKAAIQEAKHSCPLIEGKWEDVLLLLRNMEYSFPHPEEGRQPSDVNIFLKKLVPKNPEHHAPNLELEIHDCGVDTAIYAILFQSMTNAHISPPIPYKLSLVSNGRSSFLELSVFKKVEIEVKNDTLGLSNADKSVEWLKVTLLPKFCKWAATPLNASIGSLKLVPVASYGVLYQSLKNKHAAKLMDLWPESTDPQKFIHEDLGIAAYLLLLWEQERHEKGLKEKQSFVDIGCGNGLLVYILTEEGHPGLGVDVRSRRIWDIYPPTTTLKVCTINPSEKSPFPAMDWLIGNHSDELTPWIPVMAAMIPGSRYFVLPCCPYDFFGRYGRKNPGKSIYQEYLEFIQKNVSEHLCKFVTITDRLRIPSTKRVCIIGSQRVEESECEAYGDTTPHDFLIQSLGFKLSPTISPVQGDANSKGQALFIPRPAQERVRNCTKVDPNVIAQVVSLVAAELLAGQKEAHTYEEGWDCGRTVSLGALAKVIPPHFLEKLKRECGGLQTLLKNNHFIFKVASGLVGFRKPTLREHLKKDSLGKRKHSAGKEIKSNWKSRLCWFNVYHPNGCPLLDAQCSYIHEK
ncbi:probable tRNA (uracil-O(2)-)-methyltransferase [Hetaerina americana]|uniref:probable tRNA (uracil-O(2)-)-methyltransferase n=1 Tax=Hetaerina americana TaxID=62018 RepID=UPI003A7F2DB1